MEENANKKLNDQEQMFADSYIVVPQKVRAAKEAGYSEVNARQIGYEIYNRPHVKAYIEKRLSDLTISKGETIKLVSDIASSNLTDYLTKRIELHIPKVKRGLQFLIDELQYNIEIEREFIKIAELKTDELKLSEAKIISMERDIIRFDIELNKNPNAFRIVDGEPSLIEVMDLDLSAIAFDKERGKIKSFKYTKDGIQVEGYSALDAAEKLLKVHGAFEKDNEQSKPSLFDISKLTIQEMKDLLQLTKKASD